MADSYDPTNSTQTDGAGWRVGPPYRGTYDILSTCLVTTGLCVWTALHLNVPAPKKASRKWRRKLAWLVIGLFAPEVVAWTAFRQHRAASRLHAILNSALGQEVPKGFVQAVAQLWRRRHENKPQEQQVCGANGRYLWTMMHSHYAIMGGFAIVPGEKSPRGHTELFVPVYYEHLTITADGLELLASLHPDMIPNISQSAIRDKSKANSLAKALVCIQALWFCVQCVARLSQGLRLSLLELNTCAHALCAFCVYSLWWHKPLDIEEPTIFEGNQSNLPAITLLCMASNFGKKRKNSKGYGTSLTPNFKEIAAGVSRPESTELTKEKPYHHGGADLYERDEFYGFQIHNAVVPNPQYLYADYRTGPVYLPSDKTACLQLTAQEVRCLDLASQAISRYGVTSSTFRKTDGVLKKHIPDRPQLSGFKPSFGKESINFLLGFSIAGFAYGGLHLSAWDYPFPTEAEQFLWRLSGLVLISSGPALVFRLVAESAVGKYLDSGKNSFLNCLGCLGVGLPWYLCIGAAYVLYVLARVYLLVECFVTLWHLPDAAYLVPQWTQYLPHIS